MVLCRWKGEGGCAEEAHYSYTHHTGGFIPACFGHAVAVRERQGGSVRALADGRVVLPMKYPGQPARAVVGAVGERYVGGTTGYVKET